MTLKIPLPVDGLLPEILSALEKHPSLVLQATPGSGKTTRVPPALLRAPWRKPEKEVLVLEPRRLAAKYAARRVADEGGEAVGKTVGYHFRFESVSGRDTRLKFLTEGMLMRYLLRNPTLSQAAAVVLDEFHERHLHGDLALAFLHHLQKTSRPDLKLVVMSATLDAEKVSRYLDNCPIVTLETRLFPVSIDYLAKPPTKHLDQLVAEAARQATGDTLVFLPGMAEIRRAENALLDYGRREGVRICALHGELSREEQDFAIAKGTQRKIILSTNVAETSLTIEGITHVIDSGLHRQASHSWWSGVPALRTKAISKASAEQRAGRAGRLSAGRCTRLYLKSDYDTRPGFDVPEIRRTDLAGTLLELKNLGIDDARAFPWFEPPDEGALQAAETLLFRLGALSPAGALTDLGKKLVEFPAHPRLARFLWESSLRGVKEKAATLAAQISEGRLEKLDALEGLHAADDSLRRARQHFLDVLPPGKSSPPASWEDALAFSVLTGFPDRIAKRREKSLEVVLSAGGSAKVDDTPLTRDHPLFVALDLQERQFAGQAKATLKVFSLVPIKEEWLFDLEPSLVEEKDETVWDSAKQKAVGVSRLVYDQIVLAESFGEPKDTAKAGLLLLKEGLGVRAEQLKDLSLEDWCATLAKVSSREEIEYLVVRLMLAGNCAAPDVAAKLCEMVSSETSFSLGDLKKTNWTERILAAFPEQLEQLDRLVPSHVKLAGGRNLKINYELGKPPWVESRLQDFFGLGQGPSLMNGKVPVTLHLLAPNYRAVQVTTDLAGFWVRSYPTIRKELSRKYPRHSWPEDPRNATPPPPKPPRVKNSPKR